MGKKGLLHVKEKRKPLPSVSDFPLFPKVCCVQLTRERLPAQHVTESHPHTLQAMECKQLM
jgi:hypothetical protein